MQVQGEGLLFVPPSHSTDKFTVVLAVVPVLALVAVTVMGKVPAGVPGTCPRPPHPASNSSNAIPASQSLRFLPLFRASPNPASPKTGNSTAYHGGAVSVPSGKTEADPAVDVMVIVTVAESWLSDGGLKLQVTPAGKPPQANVIAPRPALESTVNVAEVVPPRRTCRLPPLKLICSGAPTWVRSLAESLEVFTSPPPETVAVLVILAGLPAGTLTVSVMGG